jgi:hypothetical protein
MTSDRVCATPAHPRAAIQLNPRADPANTLANGACDMPIDQLIFVGLNGYVMALRRDTGEIVWTNSEMHSGYVSLLLGGDRLGRPGPAAAAAFTPTRLV